jgi:hypothetical protein
VHAVPTGQRPFEFSKMFKNLFGTDKRAGSPKPDGKPAAASSKADAHQLLGLATDSLQRLRVMQPTDPEAFPLLNEASRCGKHDSSSAQIALHMAV